MQHEAAAPGADISSKTYLMLLADAALYCAAAFFCADFALLADDGFLSRTAGACGVAVCVLALLGLEVLKERRGGGGYKPRAGGALLNIAFLLAVFAILPVALVHRTPVGKGATYLFLALEWHKFPRNYILLWRAAPVVVLAAAALYALCVRVCMSGRRARILLAGALFLIFVLAALQSLAVVNFDAKKNLSFFFYPLLFAAAAVAGGPRMFARAASAAFAFALVGLFYIGLVPPGFARGGGVAESQYVKKVFDPYAVDSDIAPMFFREMAVDQDERRAYISYGPTSGIARIDIARGRLDGIQHIPGMMRYLWDPGEGEGWIAGLDWLHADLHVFGREPFRRIRTVDLFATDHAPSPFDFEIDPARGRLYIINYEVPGISVYAWPGMKKIARSHFRAQGITKLNSGGQRIALDRAGNKIYALAGWVDWRQNYLVLAINPETLAVERTLRLPTAGLELLYCDASRTLFSVDFYGHDLYEIETPSLRVKRILKAPLGSRNVLCDMGRRAIYATGYADGMFAAIDYDTGRTLASFPIGAKPSSLTQPPGSGRVFAASGAGIFSIDVEAMLRDARAKRGGR